MSATLSIDWRRPGCGAGCMPRQHDPDEHEEYGRLLERWDSHPHIVQTGNLTIELHAHRVLVDGVETHVSGREWGVLAYLAERIGRYCRQEDILAAIWGREWVTRRGDAREDRLRPYRPDLRPIAVTLHRLRPRLGSARGLITTLPETGLRLERVPPT